MNRKGFTLVELIGSMVILGLLMIVVVPNVVGLMNSNRETVYVEDAKKLVNIAKSKVSNHKIKLLADDQCTFFGLAYLENSEFDNPPNGGCYDVNRSYVVVKKNGTTKEYEYYVKLVEFYENKYNGIVQPTEIKSLTKDKVVQNVAQTGVKAFNYENSSTSSEVLLAPICASYEESFTKNGPKVYFSESEGICAKP